MAVYLHSSTKDPGVFTGTTNNWSLAYGQGFGIRSQITEHIGLRLELYSPSFSDATNVSNLILTYSF